MFDRFLVWENKEMTVLFVDRFWSVSGNGEFLSDRGPTSLTSEPALKFMFENCRLDWIPVLIIKM